MKQTSWAAVEYPGTVGNIRKLWVVPYLSGRVYHGFWWGNLICVMLHDAKLDYTCIRRGSRERGLKQCPGCVKTGSSWLRASLFVSCHHLCTD